MLTSVVSGGVADIAAIVGDPNLQIRHLPTDGLVAFGRKTRTHTKAQIEALAKVIDAFGFIVPVIVDEKDKVLAGNARIEAARLLGLKTVPTVHISHLSTALKRAFVIADNKLAELAGWDRDTLRIEFEELRELDLDFTLDLTGFTQSQIDAAVLGGDGADDRKADLVPATVSTTVSQLGDTWVMPVTTSNCSWRWHSGSWNQGQSFLGAGTWTPWPRL